MRFVFAHIDLQSLDLFSLLLVVHAPRRWWDVSRPEEGKAPYAVSVNVALGTSCFEGVSVPFACLAEAVDAVLDLQYQSRKV